MKNLARRLQIEAIIKASTCSEGDELLQGCPKFPMIIEPETFSISPEEALKLFVQNNWLGPKKALPEDLSSFQEANRDEILKSLIVDGEYPYRLVIAPILLLIAKSCSDAWMQMRAHFLHQRILEEPTGSLKSLVFGLIDANLETAAEKYGPSVFTEVCLIYQFYHEEKLARAMLSESAKMAHFSFELSGALGKLSQHQSVEATQLTVKVSSASEAAENSKAVPKDLPLNDDVLLERAALSESHDHSLNNDSLTVLLAEANQLLVFHARDEAVSEKASAYVSKALEEPNTWSIYSTALFLRSKLESSRARKVERATLQIQALVDQVSAAEPAFEERFAYFFATALPSPWEMDSTQGYMFASLGAFRTALEIFNRRERWDEAISCMMQLGDSVGAEARIASEMTRMPENPKLWCLLGDLRKNDLDCYKKAWEISGRKYSRAQRSIGMVKFMKQDWPAAIHSYELALAINPLYPKTWFVLGCAAIQVNDSKKALNAFSRVISLDSENAEAWSNIASIHMGEDRPRDAMSALKEASRLDYANWKIQDNLFEVALGSGELLLACQALRRVAEIRAAEFELSMYQRLVGLLSKAIQFVGKGEYEMQSVKKRCLELVEQILSEHFSTNPDLWITQARLQSLFGDAEAQKKDLFKAYRAAKALPYTSDQAVFAKLVSVLVELSELIRQGDNKDELFQLETMVAGIKRTVAYPESSEHMQELNKL